MLWRTRGRDAAAEHSNSVRSTGPRHTQHTFRGWPRTAAPRQGSRDTAKGAAWAPAGASIARPGKEWREICAASSDRSPCQIPATLVRAHAMEQLSKQPQAKHGPSNHNGSGRLCVLRGLYHQNVLLNECLDTVKRKAHWKMGEKGGRETSTTGEGHTAPAWRGAGRSRKWRLQAQQVTCTRALPGGWSFGRCICSLDSAGSSTPVPGLHVSSCRLPAVKGACKQQARSQPSACRGVSYPTACNGVLGDLPQFNARLWLTYA